MFYDRRVTKVELNTDIDMTNNPCYDIAMQNGRQDQLYEDVLQSKFSIQHCRKDSTNMVSNIPPGQDQGSNTVTNNANYHKPSYAYASDVTTPPNSLSCNSNYAELERRSEDEDDLEDSYVEPNSPDQTANYLEII